MAKHHFTFLALGDSYSTGESIPLHESFPYLTVQLLRKAGLHFHAPEIVAKTGWTSFELAEHMLHTHINEQYDFVTLLIGVNNQYRGLSADDFTTDLIFLLKKAIHLSGEHPNRVVVLSIPDWGATPFAAKKDGRKISLEIDQFNAICEAVSKENKTHYLNLTEETRKAKKDSSLLAKDQLHYSGKAYKVWAEKLAGIMKGEVKK